MVFFCSPTPAHTLGFFFRFRPLVTACYRVFFYRVFLVFGSGSAGGPRGHRGSRSAPAAVTATGRRILITSSLIDSFPCDLHITASTGHHSMAWWCCCWAAGHGRGFALLGRPRDLMAVDGPRFEEKGTINRATANQETEIMARSPIRGQNTEGTRRRPLMIRQRRARQVTPGPPANGGSTRWRHYRPAANENQAPGKPILRGAAPDRRRCCCRHRPEKRSRWWRWWWWWW